MTRHRLLTLALAAVAACGPTLRPPQMVPRDATPVSASFDRTWSAVVDMFGTYNLPIKNIDKASGFIASEPMAVDRYTGLNSADCGTALGTALPSDRVSYNVIVRGDSAKATIMATGRWLYTTVGDPTECTTKWRWERAFEDSVRARAERKP